MLAPYSFPTQPVSEEFNINQLCSRPRLYLIKNFLTDEECEHLIGKAIPQKKPCWVVDSTDGATSVQDCRSSSFAYFWIHEDPIISAVEQKIARLTNTPIHHGENLQVIHYDSAQEYERHHDYFAPHHAGGQKINENGGQWIIRVISYLSDSYTGEETIFPEVNLKVIPTKGNVIVFYNMMDNGEIDPMTRHGGLPVGSGEKWATQWIHEIPYLPAAPCESTEIGSPQTAVERHQTLPQYDNPYQGAIFQFSSGWKWSWISVKVSWEPRKL